MDLLFSTTSRAYRLCLEGEFYAVYHICLLSTEEFVHRCLVVLIIGFAGYFKIVAKATGSL